MPGIVKIRKIGNSLGVILPVEMVRGQKLKAGDEVGLEVFKQFKKADLRALFGSLPRKGISGQQFKDEAKAGWES